MNSERPNFILIHTDQFREDCLGISGKRKGIFTPHLDDIAVRGMRFTAAYSTCPVCIPQRMTMMSGQLAKTHGVFKNVGIPHFPFVHTLPGELGKGGYQTAHVGRTMHLYPEDEPYGFEHFVPGNPHSKCDLFHQYIESNAPEGSGGLFGTGTGTNSTYAVPWHLPDHMHHTQWTTERALEFLRERDSDRPFMISVGYYAPHGPANPPRFHYDRYYGMDDLDDPVIGDWAIPPVANIRAGSGSYIKLEGEHLKSCRAAYYGNISFIDAQVGRILSAAGPNTYIIFTADHGEMLGDHYHYHKCFPYEGSAHIPFLVCGPGIDCLQTCDRTVGWHDVMPTLLDLAGLPIPDSVDGSSIAPLLMGRKAQWRDYIHGECCLNHRPRLPGQQIEGNAAFEGGMQYLTDGTTKYIWFPHSGREMLFGLVNDPHESHDLANDAEHEETAALWRSRLIKELDGRPEGFSDGRQLIRAFSQALSPETLEIARQRADEGHQLVYFSLPKRPELPGSEVAALADVWKFRTDPNEIGEVECWFNTATDGWDDIRIDTPWSRQIEYRDYLGTAWYATEVKSVDGDDLHLCFGGIDGRCRIWLDGEMIAERTTPPEQVWFVPYSVKLNRAISTPGPHRLVVKVTKTIADCGIRQPVSIRSIEEDK